MTHEQLNDLADKYAKRECRGPDNEYNEYYFSNKSGREGIKKNFIAGASAVRSEWIDIRINAPNIGDRVLILDDDYIGISEYSHYDEVYGHVFYDDQSQGNTPSHWMPLPNKLNLTT